MKAVDVSFGDFFIGDYEEIFHSLYISIYPSPFKRIFVYA